MIVDSLNSSNVVSYTNNLLSAWKAERTVSERYVVILIAPNDRKLRISAGPDLSANFTDTKASDIVQQMIPMLKANDFDGATMFAAEQVAEIIKTSAQ